MVVQKDPAFVEDTSPTLCGKMVKQRVRWHTCFVVKRWYVPKWVTKLKWRKWLAKSVENPSAAPPKGLEIAKHSATGAGGMGGVTVVHSIKVGTDIISTVRGKNSLVSRENGTIPSTDNNEHINVAKVPDTNGPENVAKLGVVSLFDATPARAKGHSTIDITLPTKSALKFEIAATLTSNTHGMGRYT